MTSGVYERKPKKFQKPTIAARLLFLKVGESAIFPIKDTVERKLSEVSTTWGQRPELRDMKFRNKVYLLVREGEVSTQVVVTTRNA